MKINKAYNNKKNIFLFMIVLCLFLFNCCGLDTFYYILPPVVPSNFHKPTPESDVNFRTFKVQNNTNGELGAGFSLKGSEIYYKIYSEKTDWETETKNLISLSDNESTTAIDKLRYQKNDGGYSYQLLNIKNKADDKEYHAYSFSNQNPVQIRLTDANLKDESGEKSEYDAHIINGNVIEGIPVRYNGKTFNFAVSGPLKPDPLASENDELDVMKVNEMKTDNDWYVTLFAVSKGHDSAYTPYYSNITYLGSVKIKAGEDN